MTLVTPAGHALGYVPDGPDERDYLYTPPPGAVAHQFVDLAAHPAMPPMWDQGQLGSCTAHGTAAAHMFAAAVGGAALPMLARLEVYYKARALEGTLGEDSGAMIRDAIRAAAAGIAPETDWPYDVSTYNTLPLAVTSDSVHHAVTYRSVERTRDAIQAVLSSGYPVVIGVTLWESFESADAMSTGVVRHPHPGERELGGHCMLVVGIGTGAEWKAQGQFQAAADDRVYAKVRNSWGSDVYEGGYLLMGMPYLRKHGNDFWMIETAS